MVKKLEVTMHILLIGNGAREDALAWKILLSETFIHSKSSRLYLWPEKFSSHEDTFNLPIESDASLDKVAKLAKNLNIEYVICGPEKYLAMGASDIFNQHNIHFFGPNKEAAKLESSKGFAKEVMKSAHIPSAQFCKCESMIQCRDISNKYLKKDGRVVLKADGLASGKGVFICHSKDDIEKAIEEFQKGSLKSASRSIVVEEFLDGRECSYFSILGAKENFFLGFAVDFKRLEQGDQGPNTGGMGCYTPVPWLAKNSKDIVFQKIIQPLQEELLKRNISYSGFLYVGLMWKGNEPFVVEFNVRLGDPEAQVLAAHDKRDWLSMILSQIHVQSIQSDIQYNIESTRKKTVGVVIASKDYPYIQKETHPIQEYIPSDCLAPNDDLRVFNGSLSYQNNQIIPGKGRVLTVVSQKNSYKEARMNALNRCEDIARFWKDCRWRNDIAQLVSHEEHLN